MNQASPVEMMIYLLAREVRNGELTAIGTLSPIPAAAAYLAQMTHAPKARLLVLDSPEWPFDSELEELFNLTQRGRLGLFFLSGAQIDRQANVNLVAIGPYSRPKVRLAGGAGAVMVYLYARRVALFLRRQSARSLVERVDFVAAPGGSPGEALVYAKASGGPPALRPGGPCRLISDLAVFDYQPGQGLVLASIHPGIELAQVQASTGFPLTISEPLAVSAVPDEETLELIRGPVKERLAKTYPVFAESEI